jgi:hypothetical protein
MPEELARAVEEEIRTRRLPLAQDCDWLDEVVWPSYGGLSIANVPATVARALGADLPGAALPLDARLCAPDARFERVVVILLDGLGYNLLQELRAEPEVAQAVGEAAGDGALTPLTSVFPSTTAAALSTLWTGFPPAGHGLVGTRMLLREYGVLVSSLSLSPVSSDKRQELLDWGFDPAPFLGVAGLAQVLAEAGVRSYLVILGRLAGSGLSFMLHRGVETVHGVASSGDLWVSLDELMESTRGERCLISGYWGALDAISHNAGARSPRALAEARAQLLYLRDFAARWATGDGQTMLVVLADHGHVDYRDDHRIDMADHPALADTFRMPFAAEPRARYLFLRAGLRRQAERYLREELSDRVMVMDSQAALAAGLFGDGPLHPETPARIGDLLAVCREGARMYDALERYFFTSGHGALSAGEMLVPLILRAL